MSFLWTKLFPKLVSVIKAMNNDEIISYAETVQFYVFSNLRIWPFQLCDHFSLWNDSVCGGYGNEWCYILDTSRKM